MNVNELTTAIQRQFGDESEAQITRTDILRWLNQGQLHIARKTEVLQTHAEVDVAAGMECHALPSDFLFLRRAEFDNALLEPTSLEELDSAHGPDRSGNHAGTPSYYYIWGNSIYLHPTPQNEVEGGLDIWYVRRPATLSDGEDTPEIPEQMHEDLIQYGLMKAKELDEDWEAARLLSNDVESRLGEARVDQFGRQRDTYPAVRALEGDMGW